MTKLQRFLALTFTLFVLAAGNFMAAGECAGKSNVACSLIGWTAKADMQGEKLGI